MSERYKIQTNDQAFDVTFLNKEKTSALLNGKKIELDVRELSQGSFHVIHEYASYQIDVVGINREEKKVRLKINGKTSDFSIQDRMDLLLAEMGLDALKSGKINELKAPMPGLVLDILVKVGDLVQKGDPLIILEAMKMENMIKAAGAGKIKKILATKGSAVEKGALLIQFE